MAAARDDCLEDRAAVCGLGPACRVSAQHLNQTEQVAVGVLHQSLFGGSPIRPSGVSTTDRYYFDSCVGI